MSFAGESVIHCDRLTSWVLPTVPTNVQGTDSGYHLLVVEAFTFFPYANAKPVESRHFTIGGHCWCISYMDSNWDNSFTFTFQCDVWVAPEDVIKTMASSFMAVPPSDMQRNFSSLLQSQEGTDVVFRVGGETFPAHRCVLAARSSVFKSLLFGPKKEGKLSTAADVQIEDMDAAVFKVMLGFIYGDSLTMPSAVKDEGVLLQHLLVAADRYDLRRLKFMCANKLCVHICMDTAKTILALAEKHRCDGLKKACNDFLRVRRT